MKAPYENCAAAYADGRANIPANDPKYGPHLDRDQDGTGCDKPPPGFKEKPVQIHTATKVQSAVGNDRLPQTGPGEAAGIGLAVVLMGTVVAFAFRRRRMRFQA